MRKEERDVPGITIALLVASLGVVVSENGLSERFRFAMFVVVIVAVLILTRAKH